MKIILGPKQAESLKGILEDYIMQWKEFQFDQMGDDGPSNFRTVIRNQRYAKERIDECKTLLRKMGIEYK